MPGKDDSADTVSIRRGAGSSQSKAQAAAGTGGCALVGGAPGVGFCWSGAWSTCPQPGRCAGSACPKPGRWAVAAGAWGWLPAVVLVQLLALFVASLFLLF